MLVQLTITFISKTKCLSTYVVTYFELFLKGGNSREPVCKFHLNFVREYKPTRCKPF